MSQAFLNLESKIVRHCAPTLAGLKCASLFTFRDESVRNLRGNGPQYMSVREYEEGFRHALARCRDKLAPCDVMIEVLARRTTGVLVYVWRPSLLRERISDPRVARYLEEEGYDTASMSECIARLHRRICGTDVEKSLTGRCGFPHEIGFFLGYPYEDVVGFIENHGENFLCSGCWKVYANNRDAQECFCCYKRCTEAYQGLYEQGVPIECLAALDENFPAAEAFGRAS